MKQFAAAALGLFLIVLVYSSACGGSNTEVDGLRRELEGLRTALAATPQVSPSPSAVPIQQSLPALPEAQPEQTQRPVYEEQQTRCAPAPVSSSTYRGSTSVYTANARTGSRHFRAADKRLTGYPKSQGYSERLLRDDQGDAAAIRGAFTWYYHRHKSVLLGMV